MVDNKVIEKLTDHIKTILSNAWCNNWPNNYTFKTHKIFVQSKEKVIQKNSGWYICPILTTYLQVLSGEIMSVKRLKETIHELEVWFKSLPLVFDKKTSI